MELSKYQQVAQSTAIEYDTIEKDLWVASVRLSEEVGELLTLVRKGIVNNNFTVESIQEELGDVLWSVVRLGHLLGQDMDQVAEQNLDKLVKRYWGDDG